MAQMNQSQWQQVFSIGQAHGIDNGTLYSIIMNESGGDTTSRLQTSQEDSRGIFQVNTYAHPDANTSQLYDPVYSANYWIPQLATAYKQGQSQGLSGVALAQYTERYGERPQWTSQVASNISKYFTQFTGGNASLGDQTGGSSAPSSSNPIQAVASIPQAISNGINSVWSNTKVALAYVVIVAVIIFSIYMMYKVN